MYVKREFAKRLYESTGKRFAEQGIGNFLDINLISVFQKNLQSIAKERQYQEGDMIMPNDLKFIQERVKLLLGNMKDEMIEQRKKMTPIQRNQSDPFSSMVMANDHLYAIAMQALGCPDIPESFGPDVTDYITSLASEAELEVKQSEYKKASTERHYRNQRRMNADAVRKMNLENRKRIKGKTASPIRVAQYVGEYQALKKRQKGHGAIWRFFHKKENEARTKLLQDMKSDLVSILGENINVDALKPIRVAEAYNRIILAGKAEEAFAENAISKRAQMPSNLFIHEATSNERTVNDEEKSVSGVDLEARVSMQFKNGEFKEFENSEKADPSSSKIEDVPTQSLQSQL